MRGLDLVGQPSMQGASTEYKNKGGVRNILNNPLFTTNGHHSQAQLIQYLLILLELLI